MPSSQTTSTRCTQDQGDRENVVNQFLSEFASNAQVSGPRCIWRLVSALRLGVSGVVGLILMLAIAVKPATALVEIDITQGNIEPLPIAITDFGGGTIGEELASVITSDLRNSGIFAPIDPAAFIQRDASVDQQPRFVDWRPLNAQALVVGRVSQQGGQLVADFRLWDVFAGSQIRDGQRFTTQSGNVRRLAHIIADEIYERITGEPGYFDSQVVFVNETGPKDRRIKQLAIMDYDGANPRTITNGNALVLTPRFSPTTQQITYMSYESGAPRVYLLDIGSGQRRLLGDWPGMTFAPRFSPDGRQVVMSLQSGGNSNLYRLDLASLQPTQLTRSASIDTSPSFSPDGRQIVFESDRGGSQQIYIMPASGGQPTRISFGDGSYSTPVWSPRGDLIAFTKQVGGKFQIGVMRTDGSRERILTEGFHNEGPTWAPNGQALMFFRDTLGPNGGPQLWSIGVTGRNERQVPTPAFGSDPAWSPNLQ